MRWAPWRWLERGRRDEATPAPRSERPQPSPRASDPAPAPDEQEEGVGVDADVPFVGVLPRPPGMSIEAHVERQIEEARRRGAWKDLPGKGKPLPGVDGYDPAWWIQRKLVDEGVNVPLPPVLELARDLPRELARLDALADEGEARRGLEALNARIRRVNARQASGPPSTVAPIDVEAWLAGWRGRRAQAPERDGPRA